MPQSSIGSGPGADNNENHPGDGMPSKTMGAETGASQTPEHQQAQRTQNPMEPAEPAAPADGATEAALGASSPLPGATLASPDAANPGGFPDGPNVAPSPWEKDAAQGKG